MPAGVQAMNSLRSVVLQKLLWLLKKRWKQTWPGQSKSFLKVMAKFGWPQQKSSPARVGSLKTWVLPRERGSPVSLVHHTVLLDGGRAFQRIKPISSLPLCWRATLHSRTILLPPWSLCRDRELLANVCYEPAAARLGAAAVTAGFSSPLWPS